MVNKNLFNEIKQREDYKEFKRQSRIRTVIASIIVILLWVGFLFPNNPNFDKSSAWFAYIMLAVITAAIVFAVIHYFKRPTLVIKGMITDKKRYMSGKGKNGTYKYTWMYCVTCNEKGYWGTCIEEYISGKTMEDRFLMGEEVYLISFGKSNSYILKDTQSYKYEYGAVYSEDDFR